MDAIAADGGTQTGAKGAILKRLDDKVVGAGLERLHLVGKIVAVAEDEQRKAGIEIANLAAGGDVPDGRLQQSQENCLVLEGWQEAERSCGGGNDLQIEAKGLE